ncbi:MAG: AAA family ATPase, partial [Hyphomonadaceae bacterium]|nr:AAA family ATPase [Hyphomonadaceae bacterium]
GAAGKTTLLLTIAALGAVGRAMHETMLCPKPFKSIVYDAEEPREELSRRLAAICAVLGLSWSEVIPKIMLLGMDDIDFSLASGSPGQWTQSVELVDKLVATAADPEVALIAIGPLNKLSPLDVSDNTAMSWFMKLIGQIAVRADVALLFSHHTSKDADRHGAAGAAGSALGAASIINSVRIAYTMSPLSPDDLIEQRIPEAEANRYVKLNDAKMNLTLKSSAPIVLHRAEYRLKSGDLIGALKLHQSGRADVSDVDILARAVHDLMGEQESGRVPSAVVIARWQQLDPSRATVSASALLKRLAKLMQERSNRIGFTDTFGTTHVFTTIKPTANRLDFVYADALANGV